MNDAELREWLGLTLADLLVYLAIAAVVAMYFVQDPFVDAGLAAASVGLTLASCPLGMKTKPELSGFMTAVKKVSYPACVVLVLLFVFLNWALWNE